jgi:hypothetical protein
MKSLLQIAINAFVYFVICFGISFVLTPMTYVFLFLSEFDNVTLVSAFSLNVLFSIAAFFTTVKVTSK